MFVRIQPYVDRFSAVCVLGQRRWCVFVCLLYGCVSVFGKGRGPGFMCLYGTYQSCWGDTWHERVGYGVTGNDQTGVQHFISSQLESCVLYAAHQLYVSLFHFLFSFCCCWDHVVLKRMQSMIHFLFNVFWDLYKRLIFMSVKTMGCF